MESRASSFYLDGLSIYSYPILVDIKHPHILEAYFMVVMDLDLVMMDKK